MPNIFPNLTRRRPTMQDAPAVHALITAREIADHGEPDETLDDVLAEWKDLNLAEDAWLVYASGDELVGYAAVFEEKEGCILLWYTHPYHQDLDLEPRLVALCEGRALEKLAGKSNQQGSRLWMFVSDANPQDRAAVESAGYQPYKYYFRMQANSQDEPSQPSWPPDTSIRTMKTGLDDRAVYDFIYTAFDWAGRGAPPSFEWWQGYMMRADHFVPELWFLLEYQDEIVAAALCYAYPENGWVRQLAVLPDWRRKGIGSAMLQHVFGVFYHRGQPKVSLVVDSTNPKAQNFYKNAGMYLERQHVEYSKVVKSPE